MLFPLRLALTVILVGATLVTSAKRGIAQEDNEEIRDINARIEATAKEQRRLKRLEALTAQKLMLLRELKNLRLSIAKSEQQLEEAEGNDEQVEKLEQTIEASEVRLEVSNLRLEILERRLELEELSSEIEPSQTQFRKESSALLKLLDSMQSLAEKFGKAILAEQEDRAEELEREYVQAERQFERRREILQLRFELTRAREDGDEEWIRELETELKELNAETKDERGDNEPQEPRPPKNKELPTAIQMTADEVKAAGRLSFDAEILPRLKAACYECHNQDASSGDLDLESLVKQKPFVTNRSHWLNVIQQLKVRSMPPADAEQPSENDRRAMLGWLTEAIENFDYTTVRRVGFVPAKRLTHDEYNNTVRDLVGINLRPADRFPADLKASSGFENSANSLFIQPVTLERYVGAAESIVNAAWPMTPNSQLQADARRRLLEDAQDVNPKALNFKDMNSKDLNSKADVRRILERFATRAYRRPLETSELNSLLDFFELRRSKGLTAEAALREVLQVVLISPNFLIRSESAPSNTSKSERVTDWELASRLSYFLWASMPDDELFELAQQGRLSEPRTLARQVDRMLDDPKSETLGALFAAQWLGFAELDRVQRDQIDNPWATDTLVEAMERESAMLFHSLVRRNASIDRLVDADYTFVNDELAKHYGLDGVKGSQMREISLRETPRRGVLGHASILATTSFPGRTSPVLRGNWILTTLLGTPPPPPPPNVSEFNERVADNERLSQRQKLELHRSNARCYACHSQIDPLGFALEEFEWFGRHRPRRRGKLVDALGKLPNGTQFRGLKELSATLLTERRSDLYDQFTRKMLAYALGRQLEYYDQASVQELKAQLEADQGKVRTLIRAIIQSDSFQRKQQRIAANSQ